MPAKLSHPFGPPKPIDANDPGQNEKRQTRPLTLPVLGIGGERSWGERAAGGMEPFAEDVQGVVIPDTGHWVAETAPEEMLAALTEFLAPYRDGE